MIDRLEVIRQRYNQIGEQLTDLNIVSDIKNDCTCKRAKVIRKSC